MSDLLLKKKTIEINDIMSVLGKRPFDQRDSFTEYIEGMNN